MADLTPDKNAPGLHVAARGRGFTAVTTTRPAGGDPAAHPPPAPTPAADAASPTAPPEPATLPPWSRTTRTAQAPPTAGAAMTLAPAGLDAATLADVLRVASSLTSTAGKTRSAVPGGCSTRSGCPAPRRPSIRPPRPSCTPTAPRMSRAACSASRAATAVPRAARPAPGPTPVTPTSLIRAGFTGDPDKGTPHTVRDQPASSPPSLPASAPSTTAPETGPVAAAPAPGGRSPNSAPHSTRPRTTTRARCYREQPRIRAVALLLDLPPPRDRQKRPRPGAGRSAREQSRVSFGKVAECRKRGAVHFHAVIRFDGPEGPDTPRPSWAGLGLLPDAIGAAAARVAVDVAAAGDGRLRTLRWGTQLDVQPISAFRER